MCFLPAVTFRVQNPTEPRSLFSEYLRPYNMVGGERREARCISTRSSFFPRSRSKFLWCLSLSDKSHSDKSWPISFSSEKLWPIFRENSARNGFRVTWGVSTNFQAAILGASREVADGIWKERGRFAHFPGQTRLRRCWNRHFQDIKSSLPLDMALLIFWSSVNRVDLAFHPTHRHPYLFPLFHTRNPSSGISYHWSYFSYICTTYTNFQFHYVVSCAPDFWARGHTWSCCLLLFSH